MTIPRAFIDQGVAAVIENGVARDILKAGMANFFPSPNPIDEAFQLSEPHMTTLVRLVGKQLLIDRGLL